MDGYNTWPGNALYDALIQYLLCAYPASQPQDRAVSSCLFTRKCSLHEKNPPQTAAQKKVSYPRETLYYCESAGRIVSVTVTVNDGETVFSQPFGVAVTGGTTGIEETGYQEEETATLVYNINGQRLSTPQRGINIEGGKNSRTGRRWKKMLVN